MLCANQSHFPWLQIGICVNRWQLHVTVIFHCFQSEPVLGHRMCMLRSFSMASNCKACQGWYVHVTVFFHSIECQSVLGDGISMLRSFSIALNQNLSQEMACACSTHISWLQIGTCVKGRHVQVTVTLHSFELEAVLGDNLCMLRSFFIISSWKMCQGMTGACYSKFSLFQIGNCVRRWYVHVTLISRCFKLEPELMHNVCMFHSF